MSQSFRAPKKSLPAILGAVLLTGVAAWFGLDAVGDSTTGGDADSRADGRDAHQNSPATGTLPHCGLDSLPDQAELVVEDILSGGRFTYPEHDGTHFGNYEGVLPDEQSDYYREYTVDTPGLPHRGERRIVTGGGTGTDPEVWYYSNDHYESFCEIPDAEN